MQYCFAILALAALVKANPVAFPQAVTAKISPTNPAPPGCQPTLAGSFGIAVHNVSTTAAAVKRDVSTSSVVCGPLTVALVRQIGDGQVQGSLHNVTMLSVNQTGDCHYAPATQLVDGQLNVNAPPATQTKDGQLQVPATSTAKATLAPVPAVSQTPAPAPVSTSTPKSSVTSASTSTSSTSSPASVAPTTSSTTSASIASSAPIASSARPVSSSTPSNATPPTLAMSYCDEPGSLAITLEDGVLKDQQGRVGYIAANYQFQFDGPPQAGAIITAGFSICNNGSLALGGSNVFYQCLSGTFYNLYDRYWAAQCSPVTINALLIRKCN